MRGVFRVLGGALGVCVLLGACSLRPALAARGGGAVDGVLQEAGFSSAERGQVGEAYTAAVRAGLGRRAAESLVETVVEGEFSAREVSRVLSLLARLELAGLPTEGFISKVEEGVSKGVAPSRVLEVAEQRALALRRGKSLLDALVLDGYDIDGREELVDDVAVALEGGKSESELKELIGASAEAGERAARIRRKLLR